MKPKKILRFYFGADSLERAFDNLIMGKALNFEGDALETAERLCSVIGEKIRLKELWNYLDGVFLTMPEEDKKALINYSSRRDIPLSDTEWKAAKRAVIKFMRRARRLEDFTDDFTILKKYYCLIKN